MGIELCLQDSTSKRDHLHSNTCSYFCTCKCRIIIPVSSPFNICCHQQEEDPNTCNSETFIYWQTLKHDLETLVPTYFIESSCCFPACCTTLWFLYYAPLQLLSCKACTLWNTFEFWQLSWEQRETCSAAPKAGWNKGVCSSAFCSRGIRRRFWCM